MRRKTDEVLGIMIKSLETSLEKNNTLYPKITQLSTYAEKLLKTLPVTSGNTHVKDEIISKLEQIKVMVESLKSGEFRKVYAISSMKRILAQLSAYKIRHNIK